MSEEIKVKILQNLLDEITRKYDYFISIQEQNYQKTYNMVVKDNLTNLYNRYYVEDYLIKLIEKAKRENRKVYVIFIDLDNFKNINDFYGHAKGDLVLKDIAYIMKDNFRKYDVIGRFGGDEFLVLFEDGELPENRLEKIRKHIEKIFKDFGISISYGIAIFPDDLQNHETLKDEDIVSKLINISDERMYKMKKEKNKIT